MTDNRVKKEISAVTTVTRRQVSLMGQKENNGRRSSCKAEGATSQILVANAWTCSIFASRAHI